MLDHLEIDMEVSDIGMETMESNGCKELLGDDRDANRMLVMIRKEARFSCKDGWKFINLFI